MKKILEFFGMIQLCEVDVEYRIGSVSIKIHAVGQTPAEVEQLLKVADAFAKANQESMADRPAEVCA